MNDQSNFCGTAVAYLEYQMLLVMPIAGCIIFALICWDMRPLVVIPSIIILYLWFFEDIPWRGRYYGYNCDPGGNVVYMGEEYQCYSCKHIQDQLDCKWGSAVDPVKAAHKDDWRERGPCADCMRSGALTEHDRYNGPVRWAEGER